MWAIVNNTPFEAESTWVRDQEGVHEWIVVVKATYEIDTNGILTLSEDPVKPLYTPEYNGTDGESSLRYEADLIGMKPSTDVYLNATAYSPNGKPRKKVKVSFRIGQRHKELVVYGERIWRRTLIGRICPSSPKSFEAMPITYERAFGGFDQVHPNPKKHRIDFRNPVGTGLAYRKRDLLGKPAPSIFDPSRKMGKGLPAGFGAIASFWSPRKDLAGTYDEKWMALRQPLLPSDYSPRFLLCSPLDQQVRGYLKGGELVELINLTPNGLLRFRLPKIVCHFETYFGSACKEHNSALVSVVIETSKPRLILVWQTVLPCRNDGEYLDRTVIEYKGQDL